MADEFRTLRVPPTSGGGTGWGGSLPLRHGYPRNLVLDLTTLTTVSPTFLLRVRTFVDWHIAEGRTVRVLAPSDRNVGRYMSRMCIAAGLDGTVFAGWPAVPGSRPNDVVIPVTRIAEIREVDRLAEEVAGLVVGHADDAIATVAQAFILGVSELAQNAAEHGESPTGCYVAAQRYPGASPRLVLAIADLGMGVPEHLRQRYPDITNDAQVIRKATEERVTGTGKTERGFGISQVVEEALAARLHDANLHIRSGHGRVNIQIGPKGAHTVALDSPYKRGTWVTLDLGPMTKLANGR